MSMFNSKTVCDDAKFYTLNVNPQQSGINTVLSLGTGASSGLTYTPEQKYDFVVDSTTKELKIVSQAGAGEPQVVFLTDPTGSTQFGQIMANEMFLGERLICSALEGVSTINGGSIAISNETVLSTYGGSVTGSNNISYLASSGVSDIAVVQDGVYSLQGLVACTATDGGSFSFELGIDNGNLDCKINTGTSPTYKPGGPLHAVTLPFTCVFKASSDKIKIYIRNTSGAGSADTTTATVFTPTLFRIR